MRAGFEYPGESGKLVSLHINTKVIYEAIVDLPITLNILFNFSKQASSLL